jgi:hypothetical protein
MAYTYDNQGNLVETGENIPGSMPFDQSKVNDTGFGMLDAVKNWWGGNQGGNQGGDQGTTGAFDSANFNVQDKNQVLNLQKRLFPDDPDQWDGIFGPKTEQAYRGMVNQQRTAAGQDPYTYDTQKQGGFGSGEGWLSRIGQGGEGFMGKFGTGEGWLSQGKQRRAARKAQRGGNIIAENVPTGPIEGEGGPIPDDENLAAGTQQKGGGSNYTWGNLMPEYDDRYPMMG